MQAAAVVVVICHYDCQRTRARYSTVGTGWRRGLSMTDQAKT